MLKVLELFGGIGACSKALERLGIEYEIADYVEIDKYAVKSFNAIHNTNFEPQDICEWDKDIEVDLIMHGSPCQDFSLAGKQAGGDKDSGTRSSLMYETIRIVSKLKPKYVIWENVKNLLSKKHRHNFDAYLETMEQLGYTNYYQVLNAKDYGIPQNRERVFTISIRNDSKPCVNEWFPSAVFYDETIDFEFPPKQELKLELKDMLEDEVDEQYYLTDSMLKTYQREFGSKGKMQNKKCCDTLTASMGTGGGNVPLTVKENSVYSETEKKLFTETGNIKRYINSDVVDEFKEGQMATTSFPNGYGHGPRTHDESICLNCIDKPSVKQNSQIRKITPKECWRLMGFDDEDYEKASKVNSNTQLYKQAGNSIVVNVLEAILRNLIKV